MTSNRKRGVIYTGMTNNLILRIRQHKEREHRGFTRRYNADKLVWYEVFDSPIKAITREKEIKGWIREKKIRLIESINPEWKDLYPEVVARYQDLYGKKRGKGGNPES